VITRIGSQRSSHYSKALLGHLETGQRAVKPEHVTAYAQALDVPISRFYTGSEAGLSCNRSMELLTLQNMSMHAGDLGGRSKG
jgi:hypothetical protein